MMLFFFPSFLLGVLIFATSDSIIYKNYPSNGSDLQNSQCFWCEACGEFCLLLSYWQLWSRLGLLCTYWVPQAQFLMFQYLPYFKIVKGVMMVISRSFIISLKASLFDFFFFGGGESNGLGFHSRMRSTCLYKRLWLVFSGLLSKTECYFIADIMYESSPLPFHIAARLSETWEFSLNYLTFVCTCALLSHSPLPHSPPSPPLLYRTWLCGNLTLDFCSQAQNPIPSGCIAQPPSPQCKQRLVWHWPGNGPELRILILTWYIFSEAL